MNRRGTIVLGIAVLAVLALALVPVSASSVHLKGGNKAAPSFYDEGLTLNASGELAGLSNADVWISLDAEANVTSECRNQGGHAAPGQNPAPISASGSQSIPVDRIKNGTTPFDVTTEAPDPIIPSAPDCPNPNWTEEITDLAFTGAIIRVEQGGTPVLTVECSFDAPTSDGRMPKKDVICSSD